MVCLIIVIWILSCSWHQTTNLVFPNFFHEYFSVLSVEKRKKHFSLVQNWEKDCFRPIKSLISFSTDKTVKYSWKKLGKTRLVVWWFDVTNKICSKILLWKLIPYTCHYNPLLIWNRSLLKNADLGLDFLFLIHKLSNIK